MSYRIGIVSLGCAKNRVDAEMMLFTLKNAGYQIVDDPAAADAVIVNTCGFIEAAKQESIDEILELAQLKKEGRIQAIVVTGCLSQRYQEQVMQQLYEVDAVVGIGANASIAQIVEDCLNGKKVECFPDKLRMPLSGGRLQSTPPYYAYLKVADGCDNCCSYCAIPLIRGKFRSRPVEEIVQEAKTFAACGVKELIVIAQDTTRYGEDLYGTLMLPALLQELCKIDGVRWIRLLYCYPDRITDELLHLIAKEEKIVKYLDLPLQHCSADILKAMNRRGDRESLTALIRKIRHTVPGIVLRTTLITGFPGETQQDFEELSAFVNEIGFERLGCFAYSQEEDTPAAAFAGQIDEKIKNRRQEIIMEQQHTIMERYCQGLLSRTLDVLVEGFDRYAECFFGRSAADAPDVDGKVFFTCNESKPKPGQFVKVRICDYLDCDPIGELVQKDGALT
ncbi:MAG TPA: 30S ribosomal protein S12 methylthiotransferase RimO [Candidatus Scatavimonas merdigallinarum]|uniref:Ribosomal protein uS12 methylthiotransferase RimO n=1 Tax=Candidatus Scatavimonas merdigallinarum TaxID=2840914 RepID=A0A9D0ZIK5_9FIRM|nr:30S ribosomal protein S12 methylthiotransferase RimO [Candidatus Scatavimonas merdigallinarum]